MPAEHVTVYSSGCDWANPEVFSDYYDYLDNSWDCCTSSNPCGVNEGHCSQDDQCFGDLSCGDSNCPSQFPSDASCCYDPTGLQRFKV